MKAGKEISIRKIRSYNKKSLYNLLLKRQARTLDVLAEAGDLLEELGLHTEAYLTRQQVLRVGKNINLDLGEKKQRFVDEDSNTDLWTKEDIDEIKRLVEIEKDFNKISTYISKAESSQNQNNNDMNNVSNDSSFGNFTGQ